MLQLNRNGEGKGKMSLATKITADRTRQSIVLEDYRTQPILLNNVRRQIKTP